MSTGENTSREKLAGDIAALQTFAGEYRVYLDLRSRFSGGDGGSQAALEQSRMRIWQLVPAARRAIEQSGVRLTITPPPMFGGPVLTDFSSQVFAHENAPYLPGPFGASEVPATARMVLDRVAAAIGELSDQLQQSPVTSNSVGVKGPQQESHAATSRRRAPVFGRLKRLPAWLAILADLITIGVLVVAIVGAIIAIGRGGGPSGARSPKQQGSSSHTTSVSPTAAGQTTTQPAPPELNADATCATVRDASVREVHRAIFVDSPGQLMGGSAFRGRVLGNGEFIELITVAKGDVVELSARLADPAYGAVEGVVVTATVTPGGHGCWKITARARDHGVAPNIALGHTLVVLQPNSGATVQYVPGSTRLLDRHGKVIVRLPDGVTQDGIAIPYQVPPAAIDVYYVNWEMRIR
jgi:hypothetical protein